MQSILVLRRNFARKFRWTVKFTESSTKFLREASLSHLFLLYSKRCRENDLRNGIRKRNVQTEITGRNDWILSLPAFLDILISAISCSARWNTRNICVACIFHGTNGLRATIADIGRSISLLQDDPEYRGLSAKKPEGGRERRAEAETGSLLWTQPLACRYYTTGWISLGSGTTLFATNRYSPRFPINRCDGAGAIVFDHQL